MQPASELSIIPHLHVDPLIQTEPDEIEGLLDGICRLLLKTKGSLLGSRTAAPILALLWKLLLFPVPPIHLG